MASLGLLSAGINHEIKNPLNFLVGSVENIKQVVAQRKLEGIDPFIKIMDEGINRITDIVNSLSHFSHQSDENDILCDLSDVVENCLTILNAKLNSNVKIEIDFEGEVRIKGNSGKLHQLFLNLLDNAIQALEGEGTIEITLRNTEGRVLVSIGDSGVGIPDAIKGRIFEPFFTTKGPGKGTGLGLPICHKIVSDHGGKIEVVSKEGSGTIFVINLPGLPDHS